jgi:hypothetical protein
MELLAYFVPFFSFLACFIVKCLCGVGGADDGRCCLDTHDTLHENREMDWGSWVPLPKWAARTDFWVTTYVGLPRTDILATVLLWGSYRTPGRREVLWLHYLGKRCFDEVEL